MSPLPFYLRTWKIQWQRRRAVLGAAGGERDTDREIEKRERESEWWWGGVETDWFPPPAATVQSQPEDFRDSAGLGMSPAGPSCLSAGRTSPGGPGARDSQAAPKKTIMQTEEKGVQGHKCTPKIRCHRQTPWHIIHYSSYTACLEVLKGFRIKKWIT